MHRVAGTIKQVKVNTVGGVVQPGMDLVEIVPLDDTLLVEARVRPADIAFLRPGLDAMVKLTAYDFSIYGGLEGTVEHISADAIVDDRPGATPESYYLVRVRTSHGGRGAGEQNLKIIPGMQATVDIRTGRKTVLQYLLKPMLRAKQTRCASARGQPCSSSQVQTLTRSTAGAPRLASALRRSRYGGPTRCPNASPGFGRSSRCSTCDSRT